MIQKPLRKLTDEKVEVMRISLYYDVGGTNYFGKSTQRGYWVLFSLVVDDGYFITSTPMASSNFKLLIKEAKRFSKKQFSILKTNMENNKEELFKLYQQYLEGTYTLSKEEFVNLIKGE